MRRASVLGALAFAALLGGDGGNYGPPGAPDPAEPASAFRPGPTPLVSALPRFTLFGWVSPPNESTTTERIQELAGAGLNVALPAWADSGRRDANLRRLHFAADYGVRCLAWDERFER